MSKRYPCLVSTVYPPIIIEIHNKGKRRWFPKQRLLNGPLAQIPVSSSFGNEIQGGRQHILVPAYTRYGHGCLAQENKTGVED